MNNEIIKPNSHIIEKVITDNKDIIKPLTKNIHLLDTYVTGTSYLINQDILTDITKKSPVILQRDLNNKFDSNAISVTVNDNIIGYISESEDYTLASLMDAGKLLQASIKSIEKLQYFTRIELSISLIDF